ETIGGLYVTGHNNDSFYIQVYSTGPGDEDVHSQIEIGMSKIEGGVCMVDKTKPYLTIPITITTSCVIGYAQANGTTFFDRDSGAPTPAVSPKPLYFNYHPISPINLPWRGDDWTYNQINRGKIIGPEAKFPCEAMYTDGTDNWRIPTDEELSTMTVALSWSKSRPFILSEQKNAAGKYVGSFFSYDHNCQGASPWGIPYVRGGFYKSTLGGRMIYYNDKNLCSSLAAGGSNEIPGRVRCVKKPK
ncbi:MAG: hypothetical protein RR410_05975, partial [Alistipes sp.]